MTPTEPKWTPGPWSLSISKTGWMIEAGEHKVIVQRGPMSDESENHANARLFHASRDLFRCLAALVETFHARPDIHRLTGFEERRQIEAACQALNRASEVFP